MTSKRNVNVAEAVRLINRAIDLGRKKEKLLIELRDAIIIEHATDDFPRPLGVIEADAARKVLRA